ncbi:MAG: tetratricopeptide repeat protein [Myxococcota bacterium]
MIIGLWIGAAVAEVPPLDYHTELHQAASGQVQALAARNQIDEALDFGDRFLRHVAPAAVVHYEMGLIHNLSGQEEQALQRYDQAIELDPDLAAARYDRGELLLKMGDVERATADLEAAARLAPEHWVVHFRLAELAGQRADADALEDHLIEAIRYGFDLQVLLQDPTWRAWGDHPELGPAITGVIVVYGTDAQLQQLRAPDGGQ